MAWPLGWSQMFIFKGKIKTEPTNAIKGKEKEKKKTLRHRGPTCSGLRNMQISQNIPDTV